MTESAPKPEAPQCVMCGATFGRFTVVLANRTVSSWLTSRGEAAFPAARAREMMSVEQLNALGHEKQPLQ